MPLDVFVDHEHLKPPLQAHPHETHQNNHTVCWSPLGHACCCEICISSVKGVSHILIITFYGRPERLKRIVDDIKFISGFM